MTIPTFTVEVGFNGTPGQTVGATTITWTNITNDVWSAVIRRGRQHELDRTEAGTAVILLNNQTRDYDPTYSAGPYATGLIPLRPVRIHATYNTTQSDVFFGYVEAWQQIYGVGAIPQVELRVVDAFKILSLSGLRGTTYAAENTDTRFANVLAQTGFNSSNRSSTGARSFQASADFTSQDQNALEHMQAAVQAEQGRLYARRNGTIRFDHRHVQFSAVSQFTFTEEHIRGLTLEYSDANIWNQVQTQIAASGTLHTTGDTATSQVQYLKRTLTRTGLPLDDDNEAEDLGGFLLTNYKDPALRVTGIDLNGETTAAVLWPALLDRELGHRVTVDFEPRTASAEPIQQDSFIEGIEWNLARGQIPQARLALSPIGISYTLGAPWVLASATGTTDGILGTNTVLVY